MADYISTLQGSQMDAALLDMAEHNSEAWAVGERNGIAVDSSDVAYHNNARYYASQAQSIAPASVTEAVRWDVAQTALTDAQREQARDNIEATGFNTNIFRNPWFNVNSRNFTTASVNGTNAYTVDGWRVGGIGTATKNANGTMTLAITASNFAGFTQFIDPKYMGETLRHSVMLADGTVYSLSGTMPSASGLNSYSYTINGATWQVLYRSDGTSLWVEFRCNVANTTLNIKAFKLEKSDFSTLKFDTPPDYGEELTRCIYSTADPNDTYANNGFGRSNPNLIDNPWFTVYQMGSSGHTGVGYGVDRWKIRSGAGCTVTPRTNYGITVSYTTSFDITQCLWVMPAVLANKTYTLSVLANGELLSASGIITTANQYYFGVQSSTNNYRCRIGSSSSIGSGNLYINIEPLNASGTLNIDAVKLELGTVSTLANDVPPKPKAELDECHWYCRVLRGIAVSYVAVGRAMSATNARFCLPYSMRTKPSVAFSGTIKINGANAVTAISVDGQSTDCVELSVTSSGMTTGDPVLLLLDADAQITLSADL